MTKLSSKNAPTDQTLASNSLIFQLENNKKAMLNLLEDLDHEKLVSDQEKQKYLATLKNLGEGVIAVDKQGKITLVNQAAEKMLGYSQAELLNKNYVEVIQAENELGEKIAAKDRALFQSMRLQRTTKSQYVYIRKNKTKFAIETVDTPILLGKEILGVVTVFRDVTKEREIDKAKTEFVSLASHQLRTPLGISKWYLEAIQSSEDFKQLPPKHKEYLAEVYSNNERVLSLVRDLLSVSRIDQGNVKDNPQLTNISSLLKSITKEMSIAATKKDVELRLELATTPMSEVMIDSIRLREVIENLITNAIQYNHPGGEVTIRVAKKNNQFLNITVSDNGMGIPATDLEKIFLKFFHSKKTAQNNTEGSGLGLYIAKSYVDGWGGKIQVISSEGTGSTFAITIPITNIKK